MKREDRTEKLLTVKEFADRARYNKAYVYQLIKEGKVKALRAANGRTLRIPESELDRLFES